MDIQKERELFEIEFSKIKSDISFWVNTWDEDMQGYNHPVMCWIWHIWQAAKAQAVPEGFVLVEKKSLRDTYYWDGSEYMVDHPSEYEMELERGEITTLEKWQRTKETNVYCANIYSNEDDFEIVQFESLEEAKKAVAANKAMIDTMIEAQEPVND